MIKQFKITYPKTNEEFFFVGDTDNDKFYEVVKGHTLASATIILEERKRKMFVTCTEDYLKQWQAVEIPFEEEAHHD